MKKSSLAVLSLNIIIYDTITTTTVKYFVHILKMPYSKRYNLKYSVFRHVKNTPHQSLKLAARIVFGRDFDRFA